MKKLLVVLHDAGGAEIVAAYLKAKCTPLEYIVFAAGPASSICEREGIFFAAVPSNRDALRKTLTRYDDRTLLTATGWMTTIESDALAFAKELGMHTCVYLESWTKYRERFGYPEEGWETKLPQEIWVGDEDALSLAKRWFPSNVTVRFVLNEYFSRVAKEVAESVSDREPEILICTDVGAGMEEILEEFLLQCANANIETPLRIRLHPADTKDRFDGILKKYRNKLYVTVSGNPDIASDLARSCVVVGVETTALAVALACGRNVIVLARPGTEAFLPQKALLRPKTTAEAVRLITSLLPSYTSHTNS